MSQRPARTREVICKIDLGVVAILRRLPNMSAFIRRAIALQLTSAACPLCGGSGALPVGLGNHFASILQAHRMCPCAGCSKELLLPEELPDVRPEDRDRFEQFFHGGPLYCGDCYQAAAPCGHCNWHIMSNRLGEHVQRFHADSD